MTTEVTTSATTASGNDAWEGFVTGPWTEDIDVRDFIQRNYTPYDGDASFLADATDKTLRLWDTLEKDYLSEERKVRILDVDTHTPADIDAFPAGYISEDDDVIVGLQTDSPLRRAMMPNGGWRMVETAIKEAGKEVDPEVKKIFTRYRKTHNDAVFDIYTPRIRAARSSHIITGLPDAYGRGRIIGDYRRVALYGVDFLIEQKQKAKDAVADEPFSEHWARYREEHSEQIKALKKLKVMAASYGYDISGPAKNAHEAVQWTYFAYLASVKSQDGAAMSIGRLSAFLDIYFERDLRNGVIDETRAQELIDNIVMKLRITRFLRTIDYDQIFSGDPTGPPGPTPASVRTVAPWSPRPPSVCCRPCATSVRPRSRTSRSSGTRTCRRATRTSVPSSRSRPRPSSTRPTSRSVSTGATTPRSPAACPRCAWASRCSSSAPASTPPRPCSTPSTAAATR